MIITYINKFCHCIECPYKAGSLQYKEGWPPTPTPPHKLFMEL